MPKFLEIFKHSLGSFIKELNLFPVFYIFVIYISFYILPFEILDQKTFYHLWSYEEYLAEHLQFILYFSSSIFAFLNTLKNKYKFFNIQNLSWIFFFIIILFISIEEISFIEIFKNTSFEYLREFNISNEINIHNLNFISPYLQSLFIWVNLFLGFFGWKYFSKIDAIPKKKFSLFFLICAFGYFVIEIRRYIPAIPFIHQEIFEFLMALGLFLHALESFKKYSKS